MATRFLSDAERRRLAGWPETVLETELAAYYTLVAADLDHVDQRRGESNRFGVALQFYALRHLGFVFGDLRRAPLAVRTSLASQLQVPATAIDGYANRVQTRTDYLGEVVHLLGYRVPADEDPAALTDWLVELFSGRLLSLSHDRPDDLNRFPPHSPSVATARLILRLRPRHASFGEVCCRICPTPSSDSACTALVD